MIWNEFVDLMGHVKTDLDTHAAGEDRFGIGTPYMSDLSPRQPDVVVELIGKDGTYTRHYVTDVEYDGFRFVGIRAMKENS